MYVLINLGLSKYDQEVYDHFMDTCDCFPLAAVINNKFFAVHGGISP
jgi:diadenosine tetraphosphatase ApaH/serine/threonine PP2A family protein phosphatase